MPGVEAALASARMGLSTQLFTLDINRVAMMPCNPSIGGPAKGIVVREIEALGGQMGKTADKTALQYKLLNSSKGPGGVQCLRVQSDKNQYSKANERGAFKHAQLGSGLRTRPEFHRRR